MAASRDVLITRLLLVTGLSQTGDFAIARCRLMLLLLLTGVTSHAIAGAAPDLLYDVDFEAPVHVVDQIVTEDNGTIPRRGPSSVTFGEPTIRAEEDILDGQFSRFDQAHTTPGNLPYCQLRFGVGPDAGITRQYAFYRMEFDMIVRSLTAADRFTVFIDVPNINPIEFKANQQIWAGAAGLVGTYLFDSRMDFRVDVDNAHRTWEVFMNGDRLTSGRLINLPPYRYSIQSMRMNLRAAQASSTVDLDNVRIQGMPEPSTAGAFAAAWLAFCIRRRRGPRALHYACTNAHGSTL